MAYQVNPGTTGNMSDGGEYDNFDEVTSAQYPNAAAASAAQAAISADEAAASVAQIGNELELAEAAADAAAASAASASTSATNAGNSATSATNSATSASTSATIATTKASEASASATSAASSASTATTQAASASASATSASTSAATATTKASEAVVSATNAATSATTATNKASEANNSATSASASATTATTQATNASTSATNAANSASAASTSASNAASSATTAVNAATSATNSATSAGASATSATNSATSATGSATAAYNSAVSAGTSATNSANSATASADSASASATSATNSANSATASATSATNSQTSASAASNSATSAANSASAASTSASNAATSASNALTSANNSANSATASANSATASAASATAAAASFDSFDDRYLGAKTSDPTVDNDGNALITGAMYFNSVTSLMKVYSGVSWVNTPGIATGGSAGQVLAKLSSTNYDTTWISLTGGLIYNGSWNASTNTPTLTSGSGTQGSYYVVSVSGNTNLDGVTDWVIGDWAIFNGTIWQKIDQTNLVTSVAGRTGNVTLAYADISGLNTAATQPTSAFATAAQGATADTAYADRLKWDGGATGLTASTGRTSLGLGTIATQDASNVAITGGTITGLSSALPIGSGGTGQTNATAAFNALAPSQTSNANKFLKSDGTNPSWVAVSEVPPQTSQAGKYLTTDGTTASWSAIASPNQSYTRTAFTATAGQTVFNVTYTSGTLQVYLNGVLLNSADYTATNGTSFTLASAANVDDLIEAVVFNTYAVGELPASGIVGAVPITSGGTAATTAADALTNLGAIGAITSADNSIVVTTTGTSRDLSVASSNTLISQVRNETGATLTKGTVVYISGAGGNKALVSKALASGDSTSAQTYGVVQADIANNNNGYVVVIGTVSGLNTSAFANGTQLYLSGTTAGTYTSTKPYAPIHLVYVGIVTYSHANQGTIEVKIQNGYEMDELHDVSAQSPSNGNTLVYNSSNSLWESTSTLSGSYTLSGGTANGVAYLNGSKVVSSSATLTWNNSTQQLGFQNAAANGYAYIGTAGAGTNTDLAFYMGASEGMRLTSTGLGIGTSSPAAKLDVTGNGLVSSFGSSSTAETYVQVRNGTSTLYLGGKSDQNYVYGTAAIPLTFWTNSTERMRLDSSGKLGLGMTPSGSYSLQIYGVGASAGSARIRLNNSSTGTADADGGGIAMEGVDLVIQNSENGVCKWEINGAERARITSGGQLLVGNTTTSGGEIARFQTASGATSIGIIASTNGSSYVNFGDTSDANVGFIGYDHTSNYMNFRTNAAEAMRIDSNGNLLVGTTVSQQKFMLAGNQRLYNTAVDGLTNSIIGQIDAQVRNYGAGIATNNFSSIQFCTDPTLYYKGDIRFLTNGSDGTSNASTEKARITSGGAFGVGVTPSAWDFSGPGQTPLQTMSWALSNDVNSHYQTNNAYYGSSAWRYIASKLATRYDQDAASGTHKWFIAPSGTAGNGITWTQAMTLTSGGSFLIGTTNTDISGVVGWGFNAAGGGGTTVSISNTNEAFTYNNLSTAGTAQIDFRTANVEKGNISWNNSSTSYNTSSDYRLKENIAPMTGALAKVAALKPCTYNWKIDGSDGQGFIAHELAEVVPQAVTGEKDGVREDGITPKYQGIDVSFLVATLTAAIQEQQAIIESLKARLDAANL